MTPEYARRHLAWARRQGHPVGTAISRMEQGWGMPDEPTDNQDTDRHKYVTGEYAEFFNRDEEDDEQQDDDQSTAMTQATQQHEVSQA